jgi:hypothetical protein
VALETAEIAGILDMDVVSKRVRPLGKPEGPHAHAW